MHFHTAALCKTCAARFEYITPIPDALILGETCPRCGFQDLVGCNGERVCRSCLMQWSDDVMREVEEHAS